MSISSTAESRLSRREEGQATVTAEDVAGQPNDDRLGPSADSANDSAGGGDAAGMLDPTGMHDAASRPQGSVADTPEADPSRPASVEPDPGPTGVAEVDDGSAPQGSQPHQQIETERKFDLPRRWSLPSLAGVAGIDSVAAPRRFTQSATYLDTPDLTLLRAKHTLRRRTGGSDAGWHLKKPRSGDSRLELHEPLGRSAARVPLSLRAEVADVVGTKVLMRVAVLRTRRVERDLLDASGQVLAIVSDDTVEATVVLHGERVYRWRELEVELVNGDADLLEGVTARLAASGATVSASQSKLGRALAEVLAELDNPHAPTAGQVVLDYVADQVGVLQAFEAAVRQDAPDSVHKARVATRRLRSALRTYRDLFDRTESDPLREDVAWLTAALGGPRDAEVLRDHFRMVLSELEPELLTGPAAERLIAALQDDHDKSHAALVRALDSRRYESLMSDLVDFVTTPRFAPAAGEAADALLPELVVRSGKKVMKVAAVADSSEDPAERDDAIHDVRKRAKAARYAAEAAGSVVGSQAKKIAGAWTDVQEALGDYQDSVVAREAIARSYEQARRAGEDTFTFGVLAEAETARARVIRDAYHELLTKARKSARSVSGGKAAAKKKGKSHSK